MNEAHIEFLSSPEWAKILEEELLPWIATIGGLGEDVLEVGPGPGLTTDLIRRDAERVTAVEVDGSLARQLSERLAGTNVRVLEADATDTGLEPDRFSAVACFSTLHHMPSPEHQDRLFAEAHRVLRPGGIFAAVDAADSEPIREAHLGDTFVPLDADTLGARLEAQGFVEVSVERLDYRIRCVSRKAK